MMKLQYDNNYKSMTIKKAKYRITLVVAILVALLLVWVELAVGIFGTPFAGT